MHKSCVKKQNSHAKRYKCVNVYKCEVKLMVMSRSKVQVVISNQNPRAKGHV